MGTYESDLKAFQEDQLKIKRLCEDRRSSEEKELQFDTSHEVGKETLERYRAFILIAKLFGNRLTFKPVFKEPIRWNEPAEDVDGES